MKLLLLCLLWLVLNASTSFAVDCTIDSNATAASTQAAVDKQEAPVLNSPQTQAFVATGLTGLGNCSLDKEKTLTPFSDEQACVAVTYRCAGAHCGIILNYVCPNHVRIEFYGFGAKDLSDFTWKSSRVVPN